MPLGDPSSAAGRRYDTITMSEGDGEGQEEEKEDEENWIEEEEEEENSNFPDLVTKSRQACFWRYIREEYNF